MSKESTEREKELIRYIIFLLDLMNRYAVFLALIQRDINWLEDIWADDDIKNKQKEMVETLQEKYNLPLNLETNVNIVDKMKKREN